jgi:cytochrome c5
VSDKMKLKKQLSQLFLLVGALMLSPSIYANTPEQIYQKTCGVCHANGVANAPKKGDKAQWQIRLDQRGIEGLYLSAIEGRNAMPPKGLCGECTDDQIKQVVDYLISEK